MTNPTRVGLIGCGRMGRLHVAAYRKAGAQVVAVADVNAEAARSLAQELGCAAYDDYRGMLATERLDVVSVATPPAMHRENAVIAARAGLPVFCEKPLAESVASARAFVAEMSATGVIFMVGFFHRFHEPVVRLREMVAAGALGRPVVVRSRFSIAVQPHTRPWIRNLAIAGGGAMMNTAVHSLDLIRFLTGSEVESVQALTASIRPEQPLEDAALILLLGSKGDLGLVEAYEGTPFRGYELWAQGTTGEAVVGWDPPSLKVRTAEAPEWQEVPIKDRQAVDRIENGISHFLECVRTGCQPALATGADGVRALELAEAAYRSAQSGTRTVLGKG